MAQRERQLNREEQLAVFKHVALQELNEQDAHVQEDWQAPTHTTDSLDDVVDFLEAQGVPQDRIDDALRQLEPEKNIYTRIREHDGYIAAKEILKDQIGFYRIAGRLSEERPALEEPYSGFVDIYRLIGWAVQTLTWGMIAVNEPGIAQLPLFTNGISLSHHPELILGWIKSAEDEPEPLSEIAPRMTQTRSTLQDTIEDTYLTQTRRNKHHAYEHRYMQGLHKEHYLQSQPRTSALEKRLHTATTRQRQYALPRYEPRMSQSIQI